MTRPLLTQRHELGHPVIDREHALISDYWLRTVNCTPLEFPLHLARLKRALIQHFAHETELLVAAGKGLCIRHHADHGTLLKLCAEAAELYEQDWRRTRALLRNDLAKKLREHITSMDVCTVLMLNTAEKAPCGPKIVS